VTQLASTSKPVYDSASYRVSAISELKELGKYRYLLGQLIRRDILTRYKRSVLGVAWTMLNPLGTMLILSLVFSNLFNAGGSYPVYILSGLLAWNFFSQGTNAAMSGLLWGSGLMKQIYVPRTIFGVSAIGTALVNQILSLVPLLIVILTTRSPLYLSLFFLPVAIILLAFFTLGIGLILSTLSTYFPDVSEMYQILLTAWMYLTPIIYPETIIPENLIWAFRINQMYHMVKMFRLSIYEGRLPVMAEFLPALGWAVGILVLGWLFFTSKSDEYAYRI
jgi:ABC-type polysaccharide/polyol phosphate export permease